MASKKVIKIDKEKCVGCGKCVNACHNSALALVDGKATLVGEILCDGLGACIGQCPVDALHIEDRETDDREQNTAGQQKPFAGGCPGTAVRQMKKENTSRPGSGSQNDVESELMNWPIQLKLINPAAPYFKNADVLIAADCTAFALGAFHPELLKGKALIIACPKLDDKTGYAEKLRDLLIESRPNTLTIARMEVPCCKGLSRIVTEAREQAESEIPLEEIIVGMEGKVIQKGKAL